MPLKSISIKNKYGSFPTFQATGRSSFAILRPIISTLTSYDRELNGLQKGVSQLCLVVFDFYCIAFYQVTPPELRTGDVLYISLYGRLPITHATTILRRLRNKTDFATSFCYI